MNRIILIGNGFDLAHGIRTSYSHFINDYWEKIIDELKKVIALNTTTKHSNFENDDFKIDGIPGYWFNGHWLDGNSFEDLISALNSKNIKLIFKNQFFEILTKKHKEQNWVDIENEYYILLKDSFKNESCSYKIGQLNKDFKRIQELLEIYLREVEHKFIENFGSDVSDVRLRKNIGSKIYSTFKLKDFTETSINKKAEIEFQKIQKDIRGLKDNMITTAELSDDNRNLISRLGNDATLKDVRKLLISEGAENFFELIPDEILFLSFNYTFTETLYPTHTQFQTFKTKKEIINHHIHIHGTTDKNDGNNIIFGFGDEIDEDYKSIENLNDNIFLENIKSIKYLETDNYKRLLEFLNSGDYQICIFGHSCGISDRTLLNTLFEHKNCSSIKPFYYRKDDKTDNYSDIVRNISRNFNSKSVMRDKVVNKEYCEPLS